MFLGSYIWSNICYGHVMLILSVIVALLYDTSLNLYSILKYTIMHHDVQTVSQKTIRVRVDFIDFSLDQSDLVLL